MRKKTSYGNDLLSSNTILVRSLFQNPCISFIDDFLPFQCFRMFITFPADPPLLLCCALSEENDCKITIFEMFATSFSNFYFLIIDSYLFLSFIVRSAENNWCSLSWVLMLWHVWFSFMFIIFSPDPTLHLYFAHNHIIFAINFGNFFSYFFICTLFMH